MPIPIEVQTLRQSLAIAVQNVSLKIAFSVAYFKAASFFAASFYALTCCAAT